MHISLRRGLASANQSTEKRHTICCIHNAPAAFGPALIEMWADKTVAEARQILSNPDVRVTSNSDKDQQLGKLHELDDMGFVVL